MACGPVVTFSEPQPVDVKSLKEFPRRLHGNYISTLDSSSLYINRSSIIRNYAIEIIKAVNNLDSGYVLKNDTLLCSFNGEKWPVAIHDDSIYGNIPIVDTLFRIDENGVLKKFKGYYFISNRLKGNNWEVKKINLARGKLEMSYIRNPEDIQKLKAITETNFDTLPCQINLTRKQFKQFVKDDGFSDSETFIKVKKN
jgi:hypothetical protein